MNVTLYVEGGGESGSALQAECREAFTEFFQKAGLSATKLQVVACGGRRTAYDKLCEDFVSQSSGFLALLVDSEGPVSEGGPWRHLANREGDRWSVPEGATDKNAHLMVQAMEAWLLADAEVLAEHFGDRFDRTALPNAQEIETVAKDEVLLALRKATQRCRRARYTKRRAFKILMKVNVQKVTSASPYAARLIQTLKEETSR